MSNVKVLPLLESGGQGEVPCCPPLTERPMSAEEAETAARMFTALGDPLPLRLFSAVASHEGGEARRRDCSSERRGSWVYYLAEAAVHASRGLTTGRAQRGGCGEHLPSAQVRVSGFGRPLTAPVRGCQSLDHVMDPADQPPSG